MIDLNESNWDANGLIRVLTEFNGDIQKTIIC
jgi:hypothetical protein